MARRLGIHIGLHEYVHRPYGVLNILEIVGGLVLVAMTPSMSGRDSKAMFLLTGSAATFGFNGACMLVSIVINPSCAYQLPRMHYYVVFHGASAACYLVGAFCVALVGPGVPVCSVVGFCTGGLHAAHCAHAYYKEHARRRD
ncbi:hypothetical protein MRX96_042419 [Rhipicephalus microplus]